MCMFLALHMENSPMCASPSEKFNKTGIVVCESDKIHKVVAMSCSRENLHAVQHVILNVPHSLSNCVVYLSRKPCSACTTFLIQDDPDRGVGCTLYNQNGYFFGAGYNGYPLGAIYANLPCGGRHNKKKLGTEKGPVLIHAEANALLFRFRKKPEENDILYSSKPPCPECQNYIQYVGIKKIISVQEASKSSSSQQDSRDSLKNNFEYNQWKPQEAEYTASTLSEDSENLEESTGEDAERKNDKGPPARLPNKEDLCIFLALHMENSPTCQEPSCKYVGKKQEANTLKFFKTGIVICEANKPKRIITMDCSTKDLHAVPKALLRFPNALRGCEVYLSRMPCISCAKLLIQAQVAQVYYWPNLEIQITEVNQTKIEKEAELVDNIFRESYITAAVYIPILDVETVKKRIFPRTGSPPSDKGTTPITSIYDHMLSPELLEILNLTHIKKDKLHQKSHKDDIARAMKSFQMLAGGIDTKLMENNFQDDIHNIQRELKYTHALQLCNLLAARNDSPNIGVGTLIYGKEDIVAVGYNGFPKGTVNSLFAQKDDCSCDQHAIICAEANAIILRTENDLSGTELITTSEPCGVCENLIKALKIKKIIWPNRDKKQPEDATKDPTEDEKDPSTEPFVLGRKDKTGMNICDEKILALQADREKYNRKHTETLVSGETEEKTKEILSSADEEYAPDQQAIFSSSEASASHRDVSVAIVKEDSEKTNPLLTETESDLDTAHLEKPEESHNGERPSVNAEEDKPA